MNINGKISAGCDIKCSNLTDIGSMSSGGNVIISGNIITDGSVICNGRVESCENIIRESISNINAATMENKELISSVTDNDLISPLMTNDDNMSMEVYSNDNMVETEINQNNITTNFFTQFQG